MAVVGVGRYADYLRRFLGVAGEGGPVGREINPDLHATLGLLEREEFSFLQGERRCMGYGLATQQALVASCCQITNPAGQLAVLTKVYAHTRPVNIAPPEFGVGLINTPNGVTGKGAKDTRWRGTLPAVTLSVGDPLGFVPITRLAGVGQQTGNRDFWWLCQCPIIMQPNSIFMVSNGAVNFELIVTLEWYERPVIQGEVDG